MSTPAAVRAWEAHVTLYRTVWKSNVMASFVQPLLYLLGMGLGVGALVDGGKIVAEGSPNDLIREHSPREVLELRYPAGSNEQRAPEVAGIGFRQEILPDRILIYADDGEVALKEVHARGSIPESVLVRRSSLEDVFLKLTGRSLAD